ncbi:MAG: DUF1015 family protein [Flavobacteriales bacterium]|nr:DUF1015 family protein [Flavobacteriales bacterium]
MTQVRPFKGIHPHPHNAEKAVSRAYDSYSAKEVSAILDNNPLSFLHVIKPEHGQARKNPANSPALFAKSKQRFMEFLAKDILTMDVRPAFYVYTQYIGQQSFTGILGCASVEDYDSGTVRIHEQTIASREQLLKEYLSVCDINAEPVCFTYPRSDSIEQLTAMVRQHHPLLDFATDNGQRHQLWQVNDPELVAQFAEKFGLLPHIYIADGHHRSASSVLLAHDRWMTAGGNTGPDDPHNWFLGIFFPDDQLKIFEFNRVVKGMGKRDATSLLQALEAEFEVHLSGKHAVNPQQPGHFGMYLDRKWYRLVYRHQRSTEVVASLDVSILSDQILHPLLGISDLRSDGRIGFIPGTKGTDGLEAAVNSGKYDIAFSLYPVTGRQFYAIADQGKTMPPKSTYVVPKLLNGLVIYSLSHG